jgi:hypothetical protein
MRDVARHERAGAGAAEGDLVADLEGELAGEPQATSSLS